MLATLSVAVVFAVIVVGVGRWHLRVVGHALVLVTDAYPPFRLAPYRHRRSAAFGGAGG